MATAPLMVSSNGTRTGPSTSRATVYRSDVRCTSSRMSFLLLCHCHDITCENLDYLNIIFCSQTI
jgi:hypothetical protein